MLITERAGRLRIVRNGVLDPQPIAGMPAVLDRSLKGLNDIALHPRFAENQWVYFTYYKPKAGSTEMATAVLGRGRFDGDHALTDVRDLFSTDTVVSGPSAARFVFGRDGKIYLAIGIPIPSAGRARRRDGDRRAGPEQPFRQGAAAERRWERAGRQSVCRPARPQAGALRARHPQRDVHGRASRHRRDLGNRERSAGRRRDQHHQGGAELRLAGDLARAVRTAATRQATRARYRTSPSRQGSSSRCSSGRRRLRFRGWRSTPATASRNGKETSSSARSSASSCSTIVMNQRGLPIRRQSLLRELKQRIREVRQGPDGLLYLLTDEAAGALLRIEPAS